MSENTWTVAEAIAAQKELCWKKGDPGSGWGKDDKPPHFAPGNGVCYSCRNQIYAGDRAQDGKSLVTGCRYCCTSYCE